MPAVVPLYQSMYMLVRIISEYLIFTSFGRKLTLLEPNMDSNSEKNPFKTLFQRSIFLRKSFEIIQPHDFYLEKYGDMQKSTKFKIELKQPMKYIRIETVKKISEEDVLDELFDDKDQK